MAEEVKIGEPQPQQQPQQPQVRVSFFFGGMPQASMGMFPCVAQPPPPPYPGTAGTVPLGQPSTSMPCGFFATGGMRQGVPCGMFSAGSMPCGMFSAGSMPCGMFSAGSMPTGMPVTVTVGTGQTPVNCTPFTPAPGSYGTLPQFFQTCTAPACAAKQAQCAEKKCDVDQLINVFGKMPRLEEDVNNVPSCSVAAVPAAAVTEGPATAADEYLEFDKFKREREAKASGDAKILAAASAALKSRASPCGSTSTRRCISEDGNEYRPQIYNLTDEENAVIAEPLKFLCEKDLHSIETIDHARDILHGFANELNQKHNLGIDLSRPTRVDISYRIIMERDEEGTYRKKAVKADIGLFRIQFPPSSPFFIMQTTHQTTVQKFAERVDKLVDDAIATGKLTMCP